MIELILKGWPVIIATIGWVLVPACYFYLQKYFVPKKTCEDCQRRLIDMEDEMNNFITEMEFDRRMNGLLGDLHERMNSFDKAVDRLSDAFTRQIETVQNDVKKIMEYLLQSKKN